MATMSIPTPYGGLEEAVNTLLYNILFKQDVPKVHPAFLFYHYMLYSNYFKDVIG